MRWRRLRKWAKWTCTLAAVLAVGQAVVSGFFSWDYLTTSNSGDTLWTIGVCAGQVWAVRWDGVPQMRVKPTLGWSGWQERHWYWGNSARSSLYGYQVSWHTGVAFQRIPSGWIAGASVLYPVALTSIPAALLWYADRRRFGPGLCTKCGYDRRGLAADAKCPECGTVPAPAA